MSAVRQSVDVQSGGTRESEILELAARVHADMAQLAERLPAFEESDEWRRAGMRSCADWLTVHAGFDRYTADALLRAGRAVRELPEVAEAFSTGERAAAGVRCLDRRPHRA
jgi:hypothetical protein